MMNQMCTSCELTLTVWTFSQPFSCHIIVTL